MKKPAVSIIIVNYNSRHLIKDCLDSVLNTNYPQDKFEVIVVDNDSQDDSVEFIKKNYPQIKLIEGKENLGFTGGNNLGLKHSNGKYIALLNVDTRVDPNWLQELVATASKKSVGIVSPKILYHLPFVELSIKSKTTPKLNVYKNTDSFSPLGVIVENIVCQTEELSNQVLYSEGFYSPNKAYYQSRWTNGFGKLLLPFAGKKQETYSISIHGHPHSHNTQIPLTLSINGREVIVDNIYSRQVKQYKIIVNRKDVEKKFIWLVQNAGNVVFNNGLSRDRGSVIKRNKAELKEFYDYNDNLYYQRETKLLSMCGAGCLIKRSLIDQIGLFNNTYFMYYEDVDFSLRAWRMGWNIVYQPKSVIYHKHKSLTKTKSTKFLISMIEKNHLYLLLTHFPLSTFLISLTFFLLKLSLFNIVVKTFKIFNYYGRYKKNFEVKLEGMQLAFNEIIKNIYQIYQVRITYLKQQKRGFAQMQKMLY